MIFVEGFAAVFVEFLFAVANFLFAIAFFLLTIALLLLLVTLFLFAIAFFLVAVGLRLLRVLREIVGIFRVGSLRLRLRLRLCERCRSFVGRDARGGRGDQRDSQRAVTQASENQTCAEF